MANLSRSQHKVHRKAHLPANVNSPSPVRSIINNVQLRPPTRLQVNKALSRFDRYFLLESRVKSCCPSQAESQLTPLLDPTSPVYNGSRCRLRAFSLVLCYLLLWRLRSRPRFRAWTQSRNRRWLFAGYQSLNVPIEDSPQCLRNVHLCFPGKDWLATGKISRNVSLLCDLAPRPPAWPIGHNIFC